MTHTRLTCFLFFKYISAVPEGSGPFGHCVLTKSTGDSRRVHMDEYLSNSHTLVTVKVALRNVDITALCLLSKYKPLAL